MYKRKIEYKLQSWLIPLHYRCIWPFSFLKDNVITKQRRGATRPASVL